MRAAFLLTCSLLLLCPTICSASLTDADFDSLELNASVTLGTTESSSSNPTSLPADLTASLTSGANTGTSTVDVQDSALVASDTTISFAADFDFDAMLDDDTSLHSADFTLTLDFACEFNWQIVLNNLTSASTNTQALDASVSGPGQTAPNSALTGTLLAGTFFGGTTTGTGLQSFTASIEWDYATGNASNSLPGDETVHADFTLSLTPVDPALCPCFSGTSVPEPSSLLMLGLVLLPAGVRRYVSSER